MAKPSGALEQIVLKLAKASASLRFAVILLVTLAASLAGATVLESIYDTRTAQYWVYRSFWFEALLALLGWNIFSVAMSRWPWRRSHLPFLTAHLGILILLGGSALTQLRGIDGQMRIVEGERTNQVELDDHYLAVFDSKESGVSFQRAIPWIPPSRTFHPILLHLPLSTPYQVVVDRYLTHSTPEIRFVSDESGQSAEVALKLRIQGGPMRVSQEFWLWSGDPTWSAVQMGPAFFSLAKSDPSSDSKKLGPWVKGRPSFHALATDGGIQFAAFSSEGERKEGRVRWRLDSPVSFTPPWRGGVQIDVLESISRARLQANYSPSREQYGLQAPPSAVHVTITHEKDQAEVWLGLGEQATFQVGERSLRLLYTPRQLILPFQLGLKQFEMQSYEGTISPSSFASQVKVHESRQEFEARISMNEPLEHRGFTFYQASYEPSQDPGQRPTVSIFSVNQDPGRPWKYGGSLLLVFGTIHLFASKMRRKAKSSGDSK